MKKKTTKYCILLALALMFAAPGVAAYLFFHHPSWLNASRINKGTLLNPPLNVTSLATKSKWKIAYWSPRPCEKACIEELNILARVRLALGRKLYQVDQLLVLANQNLEVLPEALKTALQEQDFKLIKLSLEDEQKMGTLYSEPKIFLVNPDNYLILSYPFKVNPDAVYKDLKLLLNTSENQSG